MPADTPNQVDFVEFPEGVVHVAGRDGETIAVTALWLARGFLKSEIIPTADTAELMRQMDAACDEEEARLALRHFHAWADRSGRLVRPPE
ncbi:MAG TPA: hypothetical protein VLA00_15910 [Xanthobacteraceae bacterium]|nr:hypothetical protein [Xanthobacteraceae bacterium]